jgi:hypothetical protein
MASETMDKEEALAFARIDFEQRSQQVMLLGQDRSRFIRLSTIIWGAPLAIAATVFSQSQDLVASLPPGCTRLVVIGASFVLSSLVNCGLLAALLGNRNAANLAASGMNYLREVYLHCLLERGTLDRDMVLERVTGARRDRSPCMRPVVSSTTDLVLLVMLSFNLLYACIGGAIAIADEPAAALYVGPLFVAACLPNIVLLRRIPARGALAG